jgi:hypothetical protein
MIASFETSAPLHVRDAFGWGSIPAGLMFFLFANPNDYLQPLERLAP